MPQFPNCNGGENNRAHHRCKRHEERKAALTWPLLQLHEKVGTQKGVTAPGSPAPLLPSREPPQPPPCSPAATAPGGRAERRAGRGGRLGAAVRAASRRRGGDRAPRPPPPPNPGPGPLQPRTYPAARESAAPAELIAERGGQRAPAGRQPRPRCCRRNPEPGAVRPSRRRGGRGGARRGRGRRRGRAGPRSACPCSGAAAAARLRPTGGGWGWAGGGREMRPHPQLSDVRDPGAHGSPGPCRVSSLRSPQGPELAPSSHSPTYLWPESSLRPEVHLPVISPLPHPRSRLASAPT